MKPGFRIKQTSWLILFFLVFILALGNTDAQITFEAKSDANQVVENGVFNVEFKLNNATSRSFTPPDFSAFKVVSGPSTSQSTTIINGQMSQSMSLTYSLLATKVGKFTIGPAAIVVNGNRLKSKPIQIEVVKAAPGGGSGALGEIFLKAEIDTVQIYPGQQQFLYYTIYTQLNVRDMSAISEDSYDDFYFRYVKDFDRRPQQVVINGAQYTSRIIKTVALFPQKTGTFTIDPLIMNVWVPKPGANTSRSFFRTYNHITKQVSSKPVTIIVSALPPGAPSSFSGAVGSFKMQSSIDRQKLTTDDALVLRMRVVGDGDSRRWSPPEIGLEDKFEVFEPNIINEKSVDQNGVVVSEKTFEYLMIPKKNGMMRFSVPFTYFSPDSSRYITLYSQRYTLNVSPGKNQSSDDINEVDIDPESIELLPFKSYAGLKPIKKSFFLSPLYWILILIPFCVLGVLFYLERKKSRYLSLDPEKRKMLEAKKRAMFRLKNAEQLLESGSSKAYYESISAAIFGYVSDKLKIPMSELSNASINSKINQLGVATNEKDRLMKILSQCQLMVYGGGTPGTERQVVFDETLQLITDLEIELN
jgi:hypothetical protein